MIFAGGRYLAHTQCCVTGGSGTQVVIFDSITIMSINVFLTGSSILAFSVVWIM